MTEHVQTRSYMGATETDRLAAFMADASQVAASGWRPASQETETTPDGTTVLVVTYAIPGPIPLADAPTEVYTTPFVQPAPTPTNPPAAAPPPPPVPPAARSGSGTPTPTGPGQRHGKPATIIGVALAALVAVLLLFALGTGLGHLVGTGTATATTSVPIASTSPAAGQSVASASATAATTTPPTDAPTVGPTEPPTAAPTPKGRPTGAFSSADEIEALLTTAEGYSWKDAPLKTGEQRSLGKTPDGRSTVELIGPRDALTSVSISTSLDEAGTGHIGAVYSAAMPDFGEIQGWLVNELVAAEASHKHVDVKKNIGAWNVRVQKLSHSTPSLVLVTVELR